MQEKAKPWRAQGVLVGACHSQAHLEQCCSRGDLIILLGRPLLWLLTVFWLAMSCCNVSSTCAGHADVWGKQVGSLWLLL